MNNLITCLRGSILYLAILIFSLNINFYPQGLENNLKVTFKGDAQLETGSSFVGLEFHHNSPAIERISFYFPVSNSVDLSNDYWKRDSSFVMAAAIRIGNKTEWLNHEKFEFTSTPYFVSFFNKDQQKEVRITYNFLKDKPAYTTTYEIKNKSNKKVTFDLYTDLEVNLKTSHSYKIKDRASSSRDNSIFYVKYNDSELQNTCLFSANEGEQPVSFSTKSVLDKVPVVNNDWWNNNNLSLNNEIITKDNRGIPAFRYLYNQELAPGETMTIVQVVGTAKENEVKSIAEYSAGNYIKETDNYRDYVLNYVKENQFTTGDSYLDKTVLWSDAMLAVDKHYIDGSVQPMPCPAEYYFYFTHDVLLTDLAAVNFDLARVKQDLTFITNHADKNNTIPHAYYWQDTAFVTEYADSDNWNHFWFVIASAKYLLHSGDKEFLNKIFPFVQKSIDMALSNRHNDLMWAIRPDWWDIGRNYGPRAYMTILATKSLREFIYISSVLGKNSGKLKKYAETADAMQKALNDKLWSSDQNYLLNYWADGSLDKHYYIGSLLASHFNLLDQKRKEELDSTAKKMIVDENVGVYSVFPMDFHKLIDFLKFQGNEAGEQGYYINGGIWPHGNAWYALSLMSAGKKKEALDFIKRDMTLNGIMDGPNGQPAMYEVRYGDKTNKNIYGKIDKPEFMWAAGWYLYSIYNLFALKENDWNITFDPYLPEKTESIIFNLTVNGSKTITRIRGAGELINTIKYDGKEIPSAVVPSDLAGVKAITIKKGKITVPYLKNINSELKQISYDKSKKLLSLKLTSFEGNNVTAEVITPTEPKLVMPVKVKMSTRKEEYGYLTTLNFTASEKDLIELYFN